MGNIVKHCIEDKFHSTWDLFESIQTKSLKRLLSREFGLVIDSNDRAVIYRVFTEANKSIFLNIERFVKLINNLYSENPNKISEVKNEIQCIIGVRFSARDKYALNKKIINIIKINIKSQGTDNAEDSYKKIQYYKNYYFQILKYQSFIDSSKLESVDLKYQSCKKEILDNKYSKYLKIYHG